MKTLEASKQQGLTKSDSIIIELAAAGKSPAEIEAVTRIPAAQVILRTQAILHDRDVWTEHERFMLFLDDIYGLKARLTEQSKATMDPKDTANLIRVLEQLGKALERQSKVAVDISDKISRTQAAWMLKLVIAGFDRAKELLAAEYPDVDIDVIEAAFREGLADATVSDDD